MAKANPPEQATAPELGADVAPSADAALDDREQDLDAREAALNEREAELDTREDALRLAYQQHEERQTQAPMNTANASNLTVQSNMSTDPVEAGPGDEAWGPEGVSGAHGHNV